ncbi:MAG: HEPN domain-containing protein [candidate division NC10 bacterium]|nr:HEPN domain-containing protein [candidate division NC10 bacterium]
MDMAVEKAASSWAVGASLEKPQMTSLEDALYRLRLAQEHLEDAEFEFQYARWSKAALSAQLSVENSAKSVIALFSPTVKAHDLAGELLDQVKNSMPLEKKESLRAMAGFAEKLGLKEHILTSYGDEVALKTPREIYDQDKARKALGIARQAVELARAFIENIEDLPKRT